MEEKKIYQIDDKPIPEIDNEELNANDFYFTNKGYEEL